MAAKLQCEICGGKLVGKPGGIFECENCGTEYSTAWAKEKIQEITGKVQVEGTVEVTGKVQVEGGTVQVDASANKDALLKRAFMMLADGEWAKADKLLEDVLNIDPECARAYLGRLMMQLKVRRQTDLASLDEKTIDYIHEWHQSFDELEDYQKIMCFGDKELTTFIQTCSNAARYYMAQKAMAKGFLESISYAAEQFSLIKGYKDADQKRAECEARINAIQNQVARIIELMYPKNRLCLWERKRARICIPMICSRNNVSIALHEDGHAVIDNVYGTSHFFDDIVAVAAGYSLALGLKADGKVRVERELDKYHFSDYDLSDWTDMIAVDTTGHYSAGLQSNGTVKAFCDGDRSIHGDVSGWTQIIAISTYDHHTVGLKVDGTVVAVGHNGSGECDVSGWKDIIAISAGAAHTVGLHRDGTVVAVGRNDEGQCCVSEWSDICAIAASGGHTVGLRKDGTVVAVGENGSGECNVSGWKNIISIAAGSKKTAGIKADGTVVCAGSSITSSGNDTFFTNDVSLFNGADALLGILERQNRKEAEILQKKKEALQKEIDVMEQRKQETETKLKSLSGMFAGLRRQGLEAKIIEAEREIADLNTQLKNL